MRMWLHEIFPLRLLEKALRVARSLQVLRPRSRTNIFGSNATGLSLPTSDLDLVVCLPPVRNLEPIKEAGILEGRNGIKETCLQIPIIMLVAEVPHDLITTRGNVLNEKIPKVESLQRAGEESNIACSDCLETSPSEKCVELKNDDGADVKSVRVDISFKSPSHTGLQTTELGAHCAISYNHTPCSGSKAVSGRS